ncbi:efflux RND transporter periplasmic adaptor subunit [Ferrimonas marina]|uniref:RND family efflux transporter, MFP subunit n=1 Tax=Ferrimonas marina TaxID=299255 RepID=A0A1M5YRL5_9GAMM|nr:efflux RND transporter periplasmic adaptor subunit [Ferrimonas marina]SHI14504.1 RND family efflux transporter, MFP subunit [Ferrimonas marina]
MDIARLLPLVLLLGLSGCNGQASSEAPDQADVPVGIPVETQPVGQDSVSDYYHTTATLEAPEEAQVVSRIGGIIETIAVEEGDQVKAGQLLATIDAQRYRLNLSKAQAELDVIEQELQRLKQIANAQLVSQEQMAKLEYQQQAALAERDMAQLQLAYSRVVSPIDGVIATRMVKIGNMAQEHTPLFHVVQQHPLHGILHLPEQELSRVQLGQHAQLEVGGALGQVPATVLRIAPTVDPNTGTFKITLLVANPDRDLKAGMFSRARLRFDTHDNALVLPRIALIRQDLGHSVFVVSEGKAQSRNVELGFSDGDRVEILSGLNPGEEVVIRGHHQLRDDTPVEVIDALQLAAKQ